MTIELTKAQRALVDCIRDNPGSYLRIRPPRLSTIWVRSELGHLLQEFQTRTAEALVNRRILMEYEDGQWAINAQFVPYLPNN